MFEYVPQKAPQKELTKEEKDHIENWNKLDPIHVAKMSVLGFGFKEHK